MGFRLQSVEHFLVLIHRQLASHLELAPLLVPLCLLPIKTEPKRGKQKRHNAIFNAIFLDKHLQSFATWPSWEERTVQFGKATQLAGTVCCRLYQTGEGQGGEQEKQWFYYRINLINWIVKTAHFSAFPSFAGNKLNFTSSPSNMNLPCMDIFQNYFLFKPILLRMYWEKLFRNDILHCKKPLLWIL